MGLAPSAKMIGKPNPGDGFATRELIIRQIRYTDKILVGFQWIGFEQQLGKTSG